MRLEEAPGPKKAAAYAEWQKWEFGSQDGASKTLDDWLWHAFEAGWLAGKEFALMETKEE